MLLLRGSKSSVGIGHGGFRVSVLDCRCDQGRGERQPAESEERFSYWISPSTYQPLQVEDRFFPGIGRFPIARVLTGSAASPNLLSLQAQHPHATVDHSRTDYKAANRVVDMRAALTGR